MSDLTALEHRNGCTAPDGRMVLAKPNQQGVVILRCRSCRGFLPIEDEPPAPESRWFLLCIECEQDIRPASGRPRIPLCRRCAELRDGRRRAIRLERARRRALGALMRDIENRNYSHQ